jgi:hypothetical protein
MASRPSWSSAVAFAKRHLGEDDDYQAAEHALVNDPVFGPWLETGFTNDDDRDEYIRSIVARASHELLY